jgi:hypothetical protein
MRNLPDSRARIQPSPDEFEALSDRVLYLEAALHHIADLIDLDLAGFPEPLAIRLKRDIKPRSLDELIHLLTAAHERFDAIERQLELLTVAVATLGIDVDLPRPRFADDGEGDR